MTTRKVLEWYVGSVVLTIAGLAFYAALLILDAAREMVGGAK